MRLLRFNNIEGYLFDLAFEDGTEKIVDISTLIGSKINRDDLKSAHIDKEWGCLEFKQGMVDIEPKTLYRFAISSSGKDS